MTRILVTGQRQVKTHLSHLEDHEAEDEEDGVHGIAGQRQAVWFDDRTIDEGHRQTHNAEETERIGERLIPAAEVMHSAEWQMEALPVLYDSEPTGRLQDAIGHKVDGVNTQHHERTEDEHVQDTAVEIAILGKAFLCNHVDEDVLQARTKVVPAHLRAMAHHHLCVAHPQRVDEGEARDR